MLTALPSWTKRPPVVGLPLAALLVTWVFARFAIACAGFLPLWVLLAINASYFLLLGAIVLGYTLAAGNYNKAGFGLAVLALGASDAAFTTAALTSGAWQSAAIAQLVVIGAGLLMQVVGAKIIPAFTDNWLRRYGLNATPSLRPSKRLSTLVTLAALVALVAQHVEVAYFLLIAAGLLVFWDMRMWQTRRVLSEPLLLAMHVGFAWLPFGFILIGATSLELFGYPKTDALHAVTMGAMGGRIMAVAGRAAARRVNGHLKASRCFVFGFVTLWITTAFRLAVPLFPNQTYEFTGFSAVLWCLAWLVLLAGYLPALIGPVVQPVLSGKLLPIDEAYTDGKDRS